MDATYVYKMRFSNSGGLKFSSPNSILEGMPSKFTFIYNQRGKINAWYFHPESMYSFIYIIDPNQVDEELVVSLSQASLIGIQDLHAWYDWSGFISGHTVS